MPNLIHLMWKVNKINLLLANKIKIKNYQIQQQKKQINKK